MPFAVRGRVKAAVPQTRFPLVPVESRSERTVQHIREVPPGLETSIKPSSNKAASVGCMVRRVERAQVPRTKAMEAVLPPPPHFLPEFKRQHAAAAPASEELPSGTAAHCFADGSTLNAMRVEEVMLDAARSQYAALALTCIAAYAHYFLSFRRDKRDRFGQAAAERIAKWQVQLALVRDGWLARQSAVAQRSSTDIQRVADFFSCDDCLNDPTHLRGVLSEYLRERGLPEDATPNTTAQHRLLFAEYFSAQAWALGNDRQFERALCVRLGSGCDGEISAVVGQVLLAGYGRKDGVARLQGIVACPFYTAHGQYRAAPRLGVADSILLHVWAQYYSPQPPFRTLAVLPLPLARRWRERLLAVPFVREDRQEGTPPSPSTVASLAKAAAAPLDTSCPTVAAPITTSASLGKAGSSAASSLPGPNSTPSGGGSCSAGRGCANAEDGSTAQSSMASIARSAHIHPERSSRSTKKSLRHANVDIRSKKRIAASSRRFVSMFFGYRFMRPVLAPACRRTSTTLEPVSV